MTDGELAELLRSVIARPDDDDVLQVYADVLIERGDPRGELIVVQLQRRTGDTAELVARERELTAALDSALAAQLAQPNTVFAWQRGFLDAIDLTPGDAIDFTSTGRNRRSLTDALRLIGTLPAARMLRRIVIRFVDPGWGSTGPLVSTLAKVAPQLRSLRELVFTTRSRDDNRGPRGPSQTGELAALCRAIPKLEVLEVAGAGYATLREVQVPSLKRLVLEAPDKFALQVLAATNVPNLEDLAVLGGACSIASLGAMLGRALPVHTLTLHTDNVEQLGNLARSVPARPLFRHVRVFELRGAPLDTKAIESLMLHVPRLRELQHFRIERTAGHRRLVQALGDIVRMR